MKSLYRARSSTSLAKRSFRAWARALGLLMGPASTGAGGAVVSSALLLRTGEVGTRIWLCVRPRCAVAASAAAPVLVAAGYVLSESARVCDVPAHLDTTRGAGLRTWPPGKPQLRGNLHVEALPLLKSMLQSSVGARAPSARAPRAYEGQC